MSILKDLETVMITEINVECGKTSLDPGEDLLEQGILDSLGIMKLIVFIEDTFNVAISDDEIIPDNFQCLNNIANLIQNKLGK